METKWLLGQVSEFHEAIDPSPPLPGGVPQRTAYVSAAAVILGLMTVALWNAQHWRWGLHQSRQRTRDSITISPIEQHKIGNGAWAQTV